MLKIISANVNGIRSAYKKGFYEYIAASGADIVCVQELKAQEADLSADMKNPHGMHGHWHCAEKRGYSGVAVYSKRKPDNVQIGMGIEEFDREGRFVRCDFGRLSVISLYLPSGSSAEERQQVKYRFLDAFYPMLEAMKNEGRDIVVCGDWNIAHQKHRPEKLERQPEKFRFPAGRARVDRQSHPYAGLDGHVAHALSRQSGLHLVEQPRTGVCEGCRVAHRLSDGYTRTCRQSLVRTRL